MPKKTAFKIPTSKALLPENRFYFTLDVDGEPTELSFPKFQWANRDLTDLMIEQGEKRKKRVDDGEKIRVVDEVYEWLEIYTHIYPEHRKAFDALADDQVMALSEAWLDSSKPEVPEEDLPESEASSTP